MTRRARSDRAIRGLGVGEDTLRRWEQRGLIRAEVLPSGVRPLRSQDLATVHDGSLTGFPEPLEEDLPKVGVREIAEA